MANDLLLMGRLRSDILLAALSVLLALATSAYAECAWVIWSETASVHQPYHVLSAHPSVGECEKALSDFVSYHRKDTYTSFGPRMWVSGEDKLFCLPDTVDPRGPKGK
jgi:hypothetical protein